MWHIFLYDLNSGVFPQLRKAKENVKGLAEHFTFSHRA